MPALNIIATQDTVRNSGSSPSLPRVMRPYLLIASQIAKITKAEADSTKAQPRLSMTQFSIDVETLLSDSVLLAPQTMNARVSSAVTPKTTRSVCGGPVRCGSPGRSARSGVPAPSPSSLSLSDTSQPFNGPYFPYGLPPTTPRQPFMCAATVR